MFDVKQSIIQEVELPFGNTSTSKLFVKRDDLIDHEVSGNKWRKLKYTLEHAKHQYKDTLVTFGGAYSNHILATAKTAHLAGLKAVGIIRGNELHPASNPVLQRASRLGMKLIFVDRDTYALRHEKYYQEALLDQFENAMLVPEGGATYHGVIGCQEIVSELTEPFDHIFVAQGTATTSAGLLLGVNQHTKVHVVPVLKGFDSLTEMRNLLLRIGFDQEYISVMMSQVQVHVDAHHGGYGKTTKELLDFMEYFYATYQIPLDHVYTGKVMYELFRWVEAVKPENQRILMLHTGGISGSLPFMISKQRRYATSQ